MKKIDGELIQQVKTIEVGAKYEAEDGKIFSNELECKQYEERLAKKKRQEKVEAAYKRVTENCIDDNFDEKTFLCKFDTKEEFIEICKTLHNAFYIFNEVSVYMNGYRVNEEKLPDFPTKLIVLWTRCLGSDIDRETINFITADDYIKELKKKIELVEKY